MFPRVPVVPTMAPHHKIAVVGVMTFSMLLTILVATLLITMAVSYTISVVLGHVPAWLPYISETGTKAPESCIFGIGMNIASFLYLVAVYLRYLELSGVVTALPSCGLGARANRWAWWLGTSSAAGLSLVANFQVKVIAAPHYLGALFCFLGGTIYFGLQANFSNQLCPGLCSRRVVRTRVVLTVLSAVALLVCLVTAIAAHRTFDGVDILHWKSTDKGYALHITSVSAEWMIALLFVSSIITYIPEMRKVTVSAPQIRVALNEVAAVSEKI